MKRNPWHDEIEKIIKAKITNKQCEDIIETMGLVIPSLNGCTQRTFNKEARIAYDVLKINEAAREKYGKDYLSHFNPVTSEFQDDVYQWEAKS